MSQGSTDAQKSQGLIQNPQGGINQRFGNEQQVDTGGGDSAGGDVDKRSFINIFIGADAASDGLVPEAMDKLLWILDQYGDGKRVRQAYQSALPADAELSQPRVSQPESMVRQLQEFRRLDQFLDQLLVDTDTPEAIRQQLKEFKSQTDNSDLPTSNISSSGKPEIIQAYLQIVVRPELSSDKLIVNGWLIPNDLEQDSAKRYQPLDLDKAKKGASCEIEEVPKILNRFLNQALEYLTGQRYELTIEVFLPLSYLCANVDSWELTDLFFEDETYLLGTKYPVIVRSQERLDPRYLASRLPQWHSNWDRVTASLASVPTQDAFEHLDQMETCNWKQVGNRLKQKLGLKMTCGLVEAHKKYLFTCILKAASPIAIWPRQDLPGQCSAINQLVMAGPLSDLREVVRQKREEADCADCPQSHVGSHLAVLWENPNRLTPDAMAQFRTPGQ
ncbi:hypothetical protein U2F10_01865 [Leptothoe sp. EHU-05/26/07-4]